MFWTSLEVRNSNPTSPPPLSTCLFLSIFQSLCPPLHCRYLDYDKWASQAEENVSDPDILLLFSQIMTILSSTKSEKMPQSIHQSISFWQRNSCHNDIATKIQSPGMGYAFETVKTDKNEMKWEKKCKGREQKLHILTKRHRCWRWQCCRAPSVPGTSKSSAISRQVAAWLCPSKTTPPPGAAWPSYLFNKQFSVANLYHLKWILDHTELFTDTD